MPACCCNQCRFAKGEISWQESLGVPDARAWVDAVVGLSLEEAGTPNGKIVSKARTSPLMPPWLLILLWEQVRRLPRNDRAAVVARFKAVHREEIMAHDDVRSEMRIQWK